MALVVHLKKGAQIIVNGAVLENVTGRAISLALKNDATILRGDDILSPDAAVTPASRVYYALQCAYLFKERRARGVGELSANCWTAIRPPRPAPGRSLKKSWRLWPPTTSTLRSRRRRRSFNTKESC